MNPKDSLILMVHVNLNVKFIAITEKGHFFCGLTENSTNLLYRVSRKSGSVVKK